MRSICIYVTIFLCSSLRYFILCIVPSAVALVALTLLQADSKMVATLVDIPGFCIACFLIWYILQRRELNSFMRERQTELKQDQLTKVFNS